MQLPSRLRDTTLGDLLAALHREHAHGVLELIDAPNRYAIHLRHGLVQAVESELPGTRLGDVVTRMHSVDRGRLERARMVAHARGMRLGQALVAAQVLSPAQLDETLRTQRHVRLEHLYALRDAEVRFRVARPLPAGASEQVPLAPRDVFHGRPRKVSRMAYVREAPSGSSRKTAGDFTASARPTAARAPASAAPPVSVSPARVARLAALRLGPHASDTEARAAYKRLVLELHPDRLGPDASEAMRTEHSRGLIAVVRAYRELVR